MNLDKLDGYEFEKLICNLLEKMGFIVEQTPLSGDGGVDIIAECTEPILKGIYLIQCKRWKGAIGEPAVRDLFGVVLARNANKGIIITNSYFSDKAKDFAEGKNIELVDGDVLNNLLKKYNIITDDIIYTSRSKLFYEMESFEIDKYSYIKKRIDENKSDKQYYDMMRKFYNSYAFSKNFAINKNGLIDEYIKLNNIIIDKFCKRKKRDLEEKRAIQYINGYLYLLKGDISKFVETFKDLSYFDKLNLNIMMPTRFRTNYDTKNRNNTILKYTNSSSRYVIIKNLMLLFKSLGYENGLNLLEEFYQKERYKFMQNVNYEGMNNDLKDFKFTKQPYYGDLTSFEQISYHYNVKHIDSVIIGIKKNNYEKFHVPLDYTVEKHYYGGGYYYDINYSEDEYISISDIMNNYISYENLEEQLKNIEFLLNM